jgi:hypothetical protein
MTNGRRFLGFLGPALAFSLSYLLASATGVNATSELRGMAAGTCMIDNDDSVEASMFVSSGEIFNGDASSDGRIQCSLDTSDGFGSDTNDIDLVTLYVYDGNDAEGISAVLASHSQLEGTFSSCGTAATAGPTTGNDCVAWSPLDQASSCMDFDDRWAFLSVLIPDSDVTDSRVIGWEVVDDE